MEARDVLAHEVVLKGPTTIELVAALGIGITKAGEVRQQRVGPNVGNMALVEGEGNAPIERGTADGQVLQAALDERDNLVLAARTVTKATAKPIEFL